METSNRTGKERRRHPRYSVDTGVELRILNDWEKHLIGYHGYAKNVSLGGICVKLPRYKAITYPRIKEQIRLQVKIPVLDLDTENYLELNGEIAWCLQKEKDYNIGIQFIENDKESKASLSRFVEGVRERSDEK